MTAGWGGVGWGERAHLDEAAVERQVVADGVLPGALVGAVIGELAHDKVVDAGQGYAARGALLDGHGDESDVAATGVPDRGAASVRVALNRRKCW